jgi:hypothetical protein
VNRILKSYTLCHLIIVQQFEEPDVLDHAAYILIAIGFFIFIISFLGYCGAIQENKVLLTAYGLFLIIIFALEVYDLSLYLLIIGLLSPDHNPHPISFLSQTGG